MAALIFLVILAFIFAVVWINLARNPRPRAKIGPDGTNVREPETFVVHHEGKGQGLDIANTALKARTEQIRRDLPGEGNKVKASIPGRDRVQMNEPPSDVSAYGSEKVAPGAVPGAPGAESKEKVLTEGPKGSRPETPEEPGSPYAKGRRVTDIYRDVELAAELLPGAVAGAKELDRSLAASPSTNGQEPGYGLGKTATAHSDGEGGQGNSLYGNPLEGGTSQGSQFPIRRTDDGMEPEDQIVASVRNPRSIYVYWETAGYGDENLQAMLGQTSWEKSVPCLRIFDLTLGAHPGQSGGHTFAIDLQESDEHCFINEHLTPGHGYVISYERRTEEGRYFLISHTGTVQLPPEGPAEGAQQLYRPYGSQPGEWSGSRWQ